MTTPPVAYSIADFATLHGIGRSTVYKLIGDGSLIARKIGSKAIRIFTEDNPDFRDRCAIATVAPTVSRRQRYPAEPARQAAA